MNHATWSVGSYSVQNWKQPGVGYSGYLNMYGRPRGMSPYNDRRRYGKRSSEKRDYRKSATEEMHKHDAHASKPCGKNNEAFHNYHYLDLNDETINRAGRGIVRGERHSDRHSHKRNSSKERLKPEKMVRCPSAPNLHQVTGIMAMHSTLAGLTALTVGVGKSPNKNKKTESDKDDNEAPQLQKHLPSKKAYQSSPQGSSRTGKVHIQQYNIKIFKETSV